MPPTAKQAQSYCSRQEQRLPTSGVNADKINSYADSLCRADRTDPREKFSPGVRDTKTTDVLRVDRASAATLLSAG